VGAVNDEPGAAGFVHDPQSDSHQNEWLHIVSVAPKKALRKHSVTRCSSPGFLSPHLCEMTVRTAKGPEDVKKSVRAADERP
jgi:hypothetical protein